MDHEYSLKGPQVEPSAGLWQSCVKLCIVGIKELTALTDKDDDGHYFPPYPTDEHIVRKELDELLELQENRDDPCYFAKTAEPADDKHVCQFPKEPIPNNFGFRRPTSKLWNLCPYPLGGVLVNRFPGQQVIRTGRGQARAVENETPGLYHRHIANYLMMTRNWSAPRQALVWAALDVAIASALQAAWYYKWLATGRTHVARRERPWEYSHRNGLGLKVLFDTPDEFNPKPMRCPDSLHGAPTPGTPRHPAYPSGHSTYSAAGAEILKYFFGAEEVPPFLGGGTSIGYELDNLADNIGLGRMWAGVHWRSDHTAGQRLGRTVACLVLKQLANMLSVDDNVKVVAFNLCPKEPRMPCDLCDPRQKVDPCNDDKPTSREKLIEAAGKIAEKCGKSDVAAPTGLCAAPPECKGTPPKGETLTDTMIHRGPQQGGGNP
jgi:membrane-associated phospholipid phosphatase